MIQSSNSGEIALEFGINSYDGYITLNIYVQPGSKVVQICGVFADALKIKISAKAVDGKANQALIEVMSTLFKLSKSQIQIIGGEKSRYKRVKLSDISADDAMRLINANNL